MIGFNPSPGVRGFQVPKTGPGAPLKKAMQEGQLRWAKLAAFADRQNQVSRISTAAAIVVVHLPRRSPTADCVMLLVRTILLEMR
jgi:hypothetical protein